ncbi:hypothetical protein [Cryobacterium aureum]|uniref:hypothetical protein n=1 Tax=Cryobacterium aureum TaxID=995037 RepID=UPI001F0BAF57|nr:hypothetical protein [Cryobacterium aureum]
MHDLVGVEVARDHFGRQLVEAVVIADRIVPEEIALVGVADLLDRAAFQHRGQPGFVLGVRGQNVTERRVLLARPLGRCRQVELRGCDLVDDTAQRGIRLKEHLSLLHRGKLAWLATIG